MKNPSLWLVAPTTTEELPLTSAVPHQVEELLFFTAGPAAPTSKSDMRVTGAAVRFRWAVALPAGGVAFYANENEDWN